MKKLLLIMAAAMCLVACDDNDHQGLVDEFDNVDPETLAVLESGQLFNEVIKRFVDDSRIYVSPDYDVEEIVFVTESDLTTGVLVSASDSPFPIYASYDEESHTAYVTTPSRGIKVLDAKCMFHFLAELKRLDVSKLYTAECTSMNSMFNYCRKLTSLDVSGFNTEKVKSMRGMFCACYGLTALDVSNFNTKNVTDMGFMFSECKSISSLDVSHLSVANVTDMQAMFQSCYVLEQLDLSHFNTENVQYMDYMFGNCRSMKNLNISSFTTRHVKYMDCMFVNCYALENLALGKDFNVCPDKEDMCQNMASESKGCSIVCTQAAKEALSDSITKLDTEKIKWQVL